jgi:cell division protein FtsL
MIRLVHLLAICAFVTAAIWVYKIKFDATVQAERVAVIRGEIKRERDQTASLRAEWARLDNPARIQDLAKRHLKLKQLDTAQYETFDRLPERPAQVVPPLPDDPIAGIIENTDSDPPTGSVPSAREPGGEAQ